jgi:hypothetical protein
MIVQDQRGVPLAVGEPRSAERLDAAVLDMLGFSGDPVGKADAALAADPELGLAHCLKAYAYLFALEPAFRDRAAASIAAGEALAGRAGPRERLHLAAARAWAEGETGRAVDRFETLLAEHPRDLLALMFAHQADFFTGREERLRSVPERTLAAMTPAMPGYGFVQGMLAFGLEEAGEHAAAEALGREAVAANPRDAWAVHAVAHVLEMQGRDEEGLAWYGEREADWAAEGNFFAVHNAWHLALFHVDRGDADGALAAYDRYLAPGRRSLVLNLCDATALLWRLHLAGVAAGAARWEALADAMARRARPGCHVFNDVHLAFALAGAARLGALEEGGRQLEDHAAHDKGDHALRLRRVGVPAALAALAFARGRYGEACDLLAPALPAAEAMTGSRAQREILALTLAEAALRDGRRSLARELLEPRLAAKPSSRALARDLRRCGDG